MALPPVVARLVGDTSDFSQKFRGAKSEIHDIERGSKKASSSLGLVGKAVGVVGGAFAAVQVGSWFKDAIMGASDLAESMSKVGVVFGESQKVVTSFADQMAKDFGLPKQQILDAAASIGLVGKASGLAQGDAAQMSTELARLAADASSFYNVPLPEALAAIQSGLVGEAEPMRRFGVLLSENAVKEEAYASGIAARGSELTEAQKVQARSALIMKGMSDASGDLERTQGSLANRIRELKGRFQNFAVEAGSRVVPVVLKLFDVFSNLSKRLGPIFREAVGGFRAFIEAFKAGDGDVTSSGFAGTMEKIANAAREVFDRVKEYWPRIKEIITEAIQTIGTIVSSWVTVITTIWKNFGSQIVSVITSAWDFIMDIVDAALNVIRGIVQVVTGVIKGDWSMVWEGIKNILSGVWDAIKAVISTALEFIKEIISVAWEIVKGIFTGAWDALKRVVREGAAFIVDVFLGFAETLLAGAAKAFSWIPGIGPKLRDAQEAFARFRDDVNAKIRGIEDRTVRIDADNSGVMFKISQTRSALQQLAAERFGTIPITGATVRQHGGPVKAGHPYIVGEKQPELFVPHSDGSILPSVPSGGGPVVHIHVEVHGSAITERGLVDAVAQGLRAKSYTTGDFRFAS